MSYSQKLIQSGKFFEFYNYSFPVSSGKKRKKRSPKRKESIEALEKKIYRFSISRTRGQISRLINANQDFKTFATFTFRDNITDLNEANLYFRNFIKRMKYKYPDLKYLAVPEFQKRGAVHYHALLNLPYIENTELAECWGAGFVMINKIKHVQNIGKYVASYIKKELLDVRYFGKRKILRSRNLNKPIVVHFEKRIEEPFDEIMPVLKSLFQHTYASDYHGEVDYEMFVKDDEN